MNYSTYRITLDIHEAASQASLNAKVGDNNRKVCASLTENGRPYHITEECRAVFMAKKPDGTCLDKPCTIAANAIEYEIDSNTTARGGVVNCEFRLLGADGEVITSPRFTIIVDEPVVSDEDLINSTSEGTALQELVKEVTELKDEAAGHAAAAEDSAQLAQEQAAFIRESMGEPLLQEKESADLLVVEKRDVSAYAQTLQMRVVSKNLIPFPYLGLERAVAVNYDDTTYTVSLDENGTVTVNGMTYTVREDGSILVDGTATKKTKLYLLQGWEPELGQVYYHSGCPAGGGYATYQLQLEATDESFTRFDLGAGAINSFKVEKEGLTVDLYIDIAAGVTLANAVFYPQLEIGEAATAYTPYLADPAAAPVLRHGRNLFDPACVLETAPAGFPAGCPVYYVRCLPDTAYYISRGGVYTGNDTAWLVATSPDEPGAGMTCTVLENRSAATHCHIVTPADARYLVLGMGYIDKMQVELGAVQTEYVPYAPPREYIPEADGTVAGVATVEWDTLFEITDPGAVLECVYKRDINNGFAEFEQVHEALREDVDAAQETADAATERLDGLKQADWEEADTAAQPYIRNKPPLSKDSNNGVVQTGTNAGRENQAYNSSAALGAWNRVRKGYSLAHGWGNQVDAEKSAAFGAYNLLRGNANLANGRSNETRGYGGASLGQDSVSAADNAVTLGQSLLATDPAQVVAGRNNAEEPGALFIVGNGDVHRSNALAVMQDGSLMAGAGFETAVRYAEKCVLQTFEGMADTVLGLAVSGGTVQAAATEDGTVAQVYSTTNAGGVRPQMILTDRQGDKLWIEQGESFTLSFKVKPNDEATLARKLFYWLCVTESETGFTATSQKNACVVYETQNIPFEEEWMTQTVTVTDCPYSGWLRLGMCTGTPGAQSSILLDDILLVRGDAVAYNYIAKNSDYTATLYKLSEVQSTVEQTEAWLTGRTLYMADGTEYTVDAEAVAASQREDRLDNLGNTILTDDNGEVLLAIVTRISPDDPDVHRCMDVHEHGVYVSPQVAGVTYEKALSRRIDVSAGDGGGVVVDNTLTQTGFAADAAVTGQKLAEAQEAQTAAEKRLGNVEDAVTEAEARLDSAEAEIEALNTGLAEERKYVDTNAAKRIVTYNFVGTFTEPKVYTLSSLSIYLIVLGEVGSGSIHAADTYIAVTADRDNHTTTSGILTHIAGESAFSVSLDGTKLTVSNPGGKYLTLAITRL